MYLNEIFRNNLFASLLTTKDDLESKSIEFINNAFNSYNRICFDNITRCAKNKDTALNSVLTAFKQNNNPEFQLRKVYYNRLNDNEIKFSIQVENFLTVNTKEDIEYKIERRELERKCEEEFWIQDEGAISIYNQLSNFDCYQQLLIDKNEINKYNNFYKNYYNVNGWSDYILNLIKTIFAEYEFSTVYSSNKVFRFLKKMSDTIYFGFEYDNSEVKKEIKKGDISLPHYLNLIVINTNLKKSITTEEYLFKYNDTILSLGRLGNPFFFEPCYPLNAFYYREMFFDKKNPTNLTPQYERQFSLAPDGKVVITHSPLLEEKLKKYAFFYLSILKNSSQGYLEYIEKSIKLII